MKKSLLLVLALVLLSVSAVAADCNPAEMGPRITEKVGKAQQDKEKFTKIDAPLHAALAEVPALREKGDMGALCDKLIEIEKMLDSAI